MEAKESDVPRPLLSVTLSGQKKVNLIHGEKLPAPTAIQFMFSDIPHVNNDDPSLHDGRIRGFGHERGNWASHVHIPIPGECQEDWGHLVTTLVHGLEDHVQFHGFPELHLSLSRTFVMRHHWIDDFVTSLKKSLNNIQRCVLSFGGLALLCNDEKTRSFLVLKVVSGLPLVESLVDQVNSCLKQYNLPLYYEHPSYHVSLAWALGDIITDISQSTLVKLESDLTTWFAEHEDLHTLLVNRVTCKVGNKFFDIPLAS